MILRALAAYVCGRSFRLFAAIDTGRRGVAARWLTGTASGNYSSCHAQDRTIHRRGADASFHIDACTFYYGGHASEVTVGPFVIHAVDGDLTGIAHVGEGPHDPTGRVWVATLTVTGGIRLFERATGTLCLAGCDLVGYHNVDLLASTTGSFPAECLPA